MHVVVTGAAGNLGTKAREMLERADWCERITAIDVVEGFATGPKTTAVVADLTDPHDTRWIEPVRAANAAVHYASANPAPTSSWAQSAKSFDMTANLLEQLGGEKPARFVFASSNHAMGGYKDEPLPPGGKLRMDTPQISGTRYWDGEMYRWGSAYGATKALGERVCAARAAATHGRITAVSTRIGWCQRGENLATTIMMSGGGDRSEPNPDVVARNLRWYRSMWLSNADHDRLIAAALTADASNWPGPHAVVSGMSNNEGMPWDLDEARQWIGYEPQDDIFAEFRKAGIAV